MNGNHDSDEENNIAKIPMSDEKANIEDILSEVGKEYQKIVIETKKLKERFNTLFKPGENKSD